MKNQVLLISTLKLKELQASGERPFRTQLQHIFRTGAALLTTAVLTSGCGSFNPSYSLTHEDPALTACSQGQAAIEVGDGFYRILCGCTGAGEAIGTIFAHPGGLTCHVASSSSVVFFYFISATQPHQIRSLGAPTFASTPWITLEQNIAMKVHSAQFSTPASTYSFDDAVSGMTGQIIVP